MNFTPDMLALVMTGEKTQTRRPMKAGEEANRWRLGGDRDVTINEVFVKLRLKWGVGREYAVCPGRGKKAVARMRVTGIRQERVSDISESDARAEGFDNCDAFFAKWRALYGQKADMQALVWVLSFKLVENAS